MYVPDPQLIADHAACIALDLRKTIDDVALDIALLAEAPDGEAVSIAIEDALLEKLRVLFHPSLRVNDLTPERIQAALGSSITPQMAERNAP